MPEPVPTNHPWTPQYAPEVEASLTEGVCALTPEQCVQVSQDAGALTTAVLNALADYTETHRCTPLIVMLALKEVVTVTNRQCEQFLERHRPHPAE